MEETPPPESPVFRLDLARKELTSDGTVVPIPPKAFDLLRFLAENAGRVVSREELVGHVWRGISVSGEAVRYAMKELRRGLGDPAGDPRFVETVARRGWRFVGRAVRVSGEAWILESRWGRGDVPTDAEPFVGREAEMASLLEGLSRAQAGQRGALFVRGEPGIGKSRLLNAFLETVRLQRGTVCARGDCLEQVGPGMPYAPLFEVLEQLCERLGGAMPVAMLRRHAPTWLAQMPSVTEPEDRASLAEQIQGANQTRMIREWVNVVECFAADRTIVIAIEDLQWADQSTLAALFYAVRRPASARILVVATLRPDRAQSHDLDLQQRIDELVARGGGQVLSPAPFPLESIRAYLAARFGADQPPSRSTALCESLASVSSGNPLFVVSLVDEYVEKARIRQEDERWDVTGPLRLESAPSSLLPLIEEQLAALESDLRELLEAASVVGMDFSASELAAALGKDRDEVEAGCDGLVADGRFAAATGAVAWPDGTVSSRYRFTHTLHRDVLRDLLSAGRRSRLHRAVGERLREAYAGHEDAIAADLATHFEAGLDPASAATFYTVAAEASARRFSNYEATEYFRRSLEQITQVEGDPPALLEIRTRLGLCAPLASVAGYAAKELEQNLARLEVLTADLEDTAEMFPAILGLWSLHFVRADFARAVVSGDRMLALAELVSSSVVRLQAHQSVGHCLFYQGEVRDAQSHYDEAVAGYDFSKHERQDYSVGDDPLVLVLTCRALSYWFLGRSDEACASAEEAVRHGKRLDHAPSLALAWTYGAVLHQLRSDVARAWEWSDRSLEITTAEGIPFWRDLSRIVRGWSIAQADDARRADGIELIREGIAGWGATGSSLGLPHFLSLLAVSLGEDGRIDDGLAVLDQASALVDETGQHVFRSEIDRFTGDLLRKRAAEHTGASANEVSSYYRRAADEAAARGLRANELQAWLALAKIEGPGGSALGARRHLADLVATYPETARTDLDLARARRVLSD